MSAEPPFNYSLNDTRSTVTLEFGETKLELTTEQLQIVLLWLGQVRSEMAPPVATNPLANEPMAPIADWRVEPLGGGLPTEVGGRIMFRSVHFGWFAIPISPEGFRHLAGGLIGSPVAKPPNASVN